MCVEIFSAFISLRSCRDPGRFDIFKFTWTTSPLISPFARPPPLSPPKHGQSLSISHLLLPLIKLYIVKYSSVSLFSQRLSLLKAIVPWWSLIYSCYYLLSFCLRLLLLLKVILLRYFGPYLFYSVSLLVSLSAWRSSLHLCLQAALVLRRSLSHSLFAVGLVGRSRGFCSFRCCEVLNHHIWRRLSRLLPKRLEAFRLSDRLLLAPSL